MRCEQVDVNSWSWRHWGSLIASVARKCRNTESFDACHFKIECWKKMYVSHDYYDCWFSYRLLSNIMREFHAPESFCVRTQQNTTFIGCHYFQCDAAYISLVARRHWGMSSWIGDGLQQAVFFSRFAALQLSFSWVLTRKLLEWRRGSHRAANEKATKTILSNNYIMKNKWYWSHAYATDSNTHRVNSNTYCVHGNRLLNYSFAAVFRGARKLLRFKPTSIWRSHTFGRDENRV